MNAKTQDRIDRVLAIADDDDKLRATIETILKEQDADTRHACAKAVNLSRSEFPWQQGVDTVLSRAYQACINTQAV